MHINMKMCIYIYKYIIHYVATLSLSRDSLLERGIYVYKCMNIHIYIDRHIL